MMLIFIGKLATLEMAEQRTVELRMEDMMKEMKRTNVRG